MPLEHEALEHDREALMLEQEVLLAMLAVRVSIRCFTCDTWYRNPLLGTPPLRSDPVQIPVHIRSADLTMLISRCAGLALRIRHGQAERRRESAHRARGVSRRLHCMQNIRLCGVTHLVCRWYHQEVQWRFAVF